MLDRNESNATNCYVLLVEDEEAHAELIRRAFEDRHSPHNIAVTITSTLKEAREIRDTAKPALILCDLFLPDGKGTELITDVSPNPNYPIVVMTSYGSEMDAVSAMKLGAFDYIVKSPSSMSDIPHIVERALREWQLHLERQASQRALAESEARFRTLFEQAADAIFIHDLSGEIVEVNHAACKRLGYTHEELLALNMPDVDISQSPAEFRNTMSKMESTDGLIFESVYKAIDGTEVPVEVSLCRLNLLGRPRILAIARDLTGRKQAEAAQAALTKHLNQSDKMRAIGQLAGGIAHDFNNLLGGIMGYADLMRYMPDDPEKIRRFSSEIVEASKRAAELTAQLLTFSRQTPIEVMTTNVHDLIERVVGLLQHTVDRRITVNLQLTAARPIIQCAPAQLQSALLNLAVNARDAMPAGGAISFFTEEIELDEQFCQKHGNTILPGRYLHVSVTDTGVGMSEEVVSHIFEPFYTTKGIGNGVGLGLAAVYGAVINHGGIIDVESIAGVGTTFHLYLPLVENKVPPKANGLEEIVTGHGVVLIVDDEPQIREMAGEMLQGLGYEVIVAEDGEKGIAAYAENVQRIDLVILDLVMPNMNGHQTLEVLKDIDQNVSILISSGYSPDHEAHRLNDPAIKGFIQKPFRTAVLSQKVAAALSASQRPDTVPPSCDT